MTFVVLITGTWPYGDSICQLQGTVISICASVLLLTLGMITINRYVKICQSSSFYQKRFSKRNILISIAISWISTVFLVSGAFFARKTAYHFQPGKCWCFYRLDLKENLRLYITCCFSLTIFGTISLIVFTYYKVIRKIRAHFIQVCNSSLHNDNSLAFAEEVKITTMLFLTILASIICLSPAIIVDLYETLNGYYTLSRQVYLLNSFSFVSSSAINPLVMV